MSEIGKQLKIDSHLPKQPDAKDIFFQEDIKPKVPDTPKSPKNSAEQSLLSIEECNEYWGNLDYDSIRKNVKEYNDSRLINNKETIVEDNKTSQSSETDETHEKKGGSYRDVKKPSDGDTHEVHHMPADSATDLDRDDGPAIKMEKDDHRQTASCGNSKEAREYRERQRELIEQGKFREALQMDIDDIREKFGDKYDEAIDEMLDYVDELEKEGKING